MPGHPASPRTHTLRSSCTQSRLHLGRDLTLPPSWPAGMDGQVPPARGRDRELADTAVVWPPSPGPPGGLGRAGSLFGNIQAVPAPLTGWLGWGWLGGVCGGPRTSGILLPHFQAGTYKYFSGIAEPCQLAFASGRVSAGKGGGKAGREDALGRCVISRQMGHQLRGPILGGLHLLCGCSSTREKRRAALRPLLS